MNKIKNLFAALTAFFTITNVCLPVYAANSPNSEYKYTSNTFQDGEFVY